MLKKFISFALLVAVFSSVSSFGVLAQAKPVGQNTNIEKRVNDLQPALKKPTNVTDFSDKETLASYQRQQAQSKKFSTTGKILLGVGIAAAAVVIFVFATGRHKVRTF